MSTGWQPPFQQVSDLESPLTSIKNLALCLMLVAEAIDSDTSPAIQQLAWTIQEEVEKAEEIRGELFRLTHPRRAHFERVGWPGDAAETDGGAS